MRQQFAAALNDQDSETAGGLEAAFVNLVNPGDVVVVGVNGLPKK